MVADSVRSDALTIIVVDLVILAINRANAGVITSGWVLEISKNDLAILSTVGDLALTGILARFRRIPDNFKVVVTRRLGTFLAFYITSLDTGNSGFIFVAGS